MAPQIDSAAEPASIKPPEQQQELREKNKSRHQCRLRAREALSQDSKLLKTI